MRKLIESTLVSLDGVIGTPHQWANFDDEDAVWALEQLRDYDAFIMGRVTYEYFFANWAHVSDDPYIELINAKPKYVASRSLTDVAWNATLLGADRPARSPNSKTRTGKTSSNTAPAASTTSWSGTASLMSSAYGSGPSWPEPGNAYSMTWTPQASNSGSPARAGWRTAR